MKKDTWHIRVRNETNWYRQNFDYNEGPFNRINRSDPDRIVNQDQMIVSEEDLEEVKRRDIAKKQREDMSIEFVGNYPDPKQPAQKNEIFKQDESYYKKIYTDRAAELQKVTTRDDGREMKIIQAENVGNKKLAIIRGDEIRGCPFGLPIVDACENAGKSVDRMAPLTNIEEEGQRDNVAKANRLVYAYHKDGKTCPYADKILKSHNKVDCDFGDTGAGQHSTSFRGSPLYPQTFQGIGLDGLYGYPLGFYADNNESRNLFFGLFSLLGFSRPEELIKLADKYDESGEDEKADILDKLLRKLQSTKENHKETFAKIEKYLEDYRDKYEKERTDTGLLWELSDAWFGPRQVNR